MTMNASIPSIKPARLSAVPTQHRQPSVERNLQGFGSSIPHSVMTWNGDDFTVASFPIHLYRFLKNSIPVISSCIWTWSRITAATASYQLPHGVSDSSKERAGRILDNLAQRIFPFNFRRNAGISGFLPMFFDTLFTDGAFAGFVEIAADNSRVERLSPVDVARVKSVTRGSKQLLALDTENGLVSLDRPDFHYFGLNSDQQSGLGKSILSSIPFVSYVERQLVEDMRRASHNSGFHRLHIRVTPPERQPGETDEEYTDRANEYFDRTTSLIRQTGVDDNPVTWDDIAIEYIGPKRARGDADGWFINHRAMIEEIAAGANLSPFLLGYSFGATETWSAFKYDLVMRQAQSVQREAARFMKWLGDLELALQGFTFGCDFVFDNSFSHQVIDTAKSRATEVDSLVQAYQSGLLDTDFARDQARRLFEQ